jgi:peptidoglycan hydrolase-like protein with peptidoglycan-binding domain
MFRTLAVASALVAAALSTHPLAAQSTASSPSKPAMHQAPAQHVDSTKATSARHAAWTKDQVKEAQQGLAKAGLYKGDATGIWNQDTRKALRAYQKQNKMPVTGRLSDSALVKLKSA